LKRLLEAAPVREPGERVGVREPREVEMAVRGEDRRRRGRREPAQRPTLGILQPRPPAAHDDERAERHGVVEPRIVVQRVGDRELPCRRAVPGAPVELTVSVPVERRGRAALAAGELCERARERERVLACARIAREPRLGRRSRRRRPLVKHRRVDVRERQRALAHARPHLIDRLRDDQSVQRLIQLQRQAMERLTARRHRHSCLAAPSAESPLPAPSPSTSPAVLHLRARKGPRDTPERVILRVLGTIRRVMSQPALAYVEELEARDRELAATIDELAGLETEVDSIRSRAAAALQLLAEAPERRAELLDRIAAARAELDRRRQALADAHAELVEAERHRSDERIDAARRAVARADDSVAAGETRLEQLAAELSALDAEAAAAERELPELSEHAVRVAGALATAPRITEPVEPAGNLLDWASRARAALFLARTSLERDRDQVVREAVELGTATLGEPVYGSTVEAVRRRLEERAGS
jgi:hypothetical protein